MAGRDRTTGELLDEQARPVQDAVELYYRRLLHMPDRTFRHMIP